MNVLDIVDYREEFHLKIFRRWYLVGILGRNTKFRDGVPMQKAALVDLLISNPLLLKNTLVFFGRVEPMLNLEELLYQDNLEFGGAQDIRDFSRTCVLLISNGYMNFKKQDGEILLTICDEKLPLETTLSQRWEREINFLQPILGKSVNVLINAILGAQNGK